MNRILLRLLLWTLLPVAGLWLAVYPLTWRPPPREPVTAMCTTPQVPTLVPGQALKVMTWNIQYLAGKRYVFWYEPAAGDEADERPTAEDLAFNLDEVVRVIRDEQPDLVLLQEVGDGARHTDYQNQLALLQERLADLYPCSTQALEWQAEFIPHPHIWGSAGLKLATLSRYRIDSAERLQLPVQHANIVVRQFQPKPALLVSYLPLSDGSRLAAINTQLYAPAADDTRRQQVETTARLLDHLTGSGTPWLMGGDFDLQPQDASLRQLRDTYPMIPANNETNGTERNRWLTHWPNDPRIDGPDRTLDYLFYSPGLKRLEAQVRQADTLEISDHLPVLGRLLLPVQP